MTEYITTVAVSYATAARAVQLVIEEGRRVGVPVVASVVDLGMALVAFGRSDGAMPHSVETSRRKANAAASARRATGWMRDDFAITLPLGTAGLVTNIRGGVPLRFQGTFVGGLGVAGGTPDQDADIAAAVLVSLGADPIDLLT